MENFWGKRKYRGIEGWNSMVEPGAYESNAKLDCSKRNRYQKQCYIRRLKIPERLFDVCRRLESDNVYGHMAMMSRMG